MLRRSSPPALLAALVLAGCGAQTPHATISAAATTQALSRSPAPLAGLHAQSDRLLSGGVSAFRARLSALRGYPVVVNKWASWCEPCQSEFPVLQRVALRYGRQVAFMGIDGSDHTQAAAAFLRRFPVSYPSYNDPRQAIADSIRAASYFPQTVFISRAGKIVFDHAGPYLSASALEQDVRRYALGVS